MHCSTASACLIWHTELLVNVLIGHKWIIFALRWNVPEHSLKERKLFSFFFFLLNRGPCPLTVPVIFSLSPALLISDYSCFMFPHILCFGTVRYLTAPHRISAHPAPRAVFFFFLSPLLHLCCSNVDTNSCVFFDETCARVDAGVGRRGSIHHVFASSWSKNELLTARGGSNVSSCNIIIVFFYPDEGQDIYLSHLCCPVEVKVENIFPLMKLLWLWVNVSSSNWLTLNVCFHV